MGRSTTENAGRKGPLYVSGCRENMEGYLTVNSSYAGLSAVPRVFSSLPPLDSLSAGGLLGEGPEQHMTLRFRGSQQTMMKKHTLTPTDGTCQSKSSTSNTAFRTVTQSKIKS